MTNTSNGASLSTNRGHRPVMRNGTNLAPHIPYTYNESNKEQFDNQSLDQVSCTNCASAYQETHTLTSCLT